MDAKELYDRTAGIYRRKHEYSPTTQWFKKHEDAAVLKYARGRTLDIGCGTGDTLKLLKDYVGVDISLEMLKIAESRCFKNLKLGDAESLPFPDKSFDSALCLFAVLNMCNIEKAAKEMARVLKPGGTAIISLASVYDNGYGFRKKLKLKNPTRRKKFHINHQKIIISLHTREDIESIFGRQGLKPVHFDSFFIFQKPQWGDDRPFSFVEKARLLAEKILPLKKYGCMYLFVSGSRNKAKALNIRCYIYIT